MNQTMQVENGPKEKVQDAAGQAKEKAGAQLRSQVDQRSTQAGEKSASVPGGGLAVYSTSSPTNVYVAYPGSDVQIEVFDPSAKRALRLVTSGRVAPVG